MDFNLVKIRITSFIYDAGSLCALTLLTALASPEFATIVTDSFGETMITGLVLASIPNVVKHVRNVIVLKKAQNQVGGVEAQSRPLTLI